MNKFATIKPINSLHLKKVTYYSVHFEEKEVTEFEDFLNRMEDIKEIEDEINNLIIWIDEIGNNYGAKERFFRHEGAVSDTSALPPPNKIMHLNEIEVKNIRLYCLRANEHVVFLFNGGIKTKQKAQDCPNVATYFKQANQLTKAINQLFKEEKICWDSDFTNIIIDEQTEIEL